MIPYLLPPLTPSPLQSETKEDPLEKYCETDPSADECRVYSD